MAAVSCSNLANGSSATPSSGVFTSTSVTPGSNHLILFSVSGFKGAVNGPGTMGTPSGNSLTWVRVDGGAYAATQGTGNAGDVEVWRSMGSSPSAGTVTFTWSNATTVGTTWSIDDCSGTDTTGTNGSGAIGNHFTNLKTSAVASPMTVTMSSFVSASSATFAYETVGANRTVTADSGMTQLSNTNAFSLTPTDVAEYNTGNHSPATATYSGAASTWGAIGIEIKVPASATCANFITLMGAGCI